ncbi:MAG: carboxypeptidase regulatory-like domain-containing protein [Candidatus Micrarchaeota archaeon]|nr:carboxypeptidase regulatory-like domain-containing protein [Candidatus Micrarchaeota archaeon]
MATGMALRNALVAFVLALAMLMSPASAGTLTGKVVDAATMAPVSGAQVNVYDTDNVLVSQLTTAQDGTFSQQNISGHLTLRILHAQYSGSMFTANAGQGTTDMGNLLLVPLATIRVSVLSNASAPLSSGVVRVIQDGNEVVARLDGASGDLKVSPGDYFVVFSAPYHLEQAYRVVVAPGEIKQLTSSLEPTPVDTMPVVQAVDVQLGTQAVNAGSEVQLKAIATYNDGHKEDVTAAALWDVGSAGVIYDKMLIATGAGTHTVRASFGGKSGTATLTVGFGKVRALDVQASPAQVYTDQPATLTSYLVDVYGNRQATSSVNYSATCGSVQGNVFRSTSACTAQVTSVYSTNASLRDTVSILVTQRDSGSSSSRGRSYEGGSSSSSSSSSSSGTSSTSTGSTSQPQQPQQEAVTIVKFIFPASAYVGDTVEVTVLDSHSNPVDGALIVVVMPDGRDISLVTANGGKITLLPATPGDYVFKSPRYVVSGTNVLTVKEVPLVTKPPIKPLDMSGYEDAGKDTGTANNPQAVHRDMLGVIFAAFSGEISPADAIKATMPLWTIIGALIFAAAVFFVVYTYMIGGQQPQQQAHPEKAGESGKQEVRAQLKPLPAARNTQPSPDAQKPAYEAAPPLARQQPPKARAKEQSRKVSDEIESLEQELKEKMARLKRLKEEQQRL